MQPGFGAHVGGALPHTHQGLRFGTLSPQVSECQGKIKDRMEGKAGSVWTPAQRA